MGLRAFSIMRKEVDIYTTLVKRVRIFFSFSSLAAMLSASITQSSFMTPVGFKRAMKILTRSTYRNKKWLNNKSMRTRKVNNQIPYNYFNINTSWIQSWTYRWIAIGLPYIECKLNLVSEIRRHNWQHLNTKWELLKEIYYCRF